MLNAGLLPRLEDEEFECLPNGRVAYEKTPREQDEETANLFTTALLASWGAVGTHGLAEFLAARPRARTHDGFEAPRALVIDQVEELLYGSPEDERDRRDFFSELSDALGNDPLLHIVLAVREDFLAQFDRYTAGPILNRAARMRLEPLTRTAALRAVTEPARFDGRAFAPGVAERLVDDLLTVRVMDRTGVARTAVAEHLEPMQLQVVCTRLWTALPKTERTITAAHIDTLVDADSALADYCRDAIEAAAEAAMVPRLELGASLEASFITPMGTRATVYEEPDQTAGVPNAAIESLENRHLIRSELRAGARWHELTHDRLIEPIRAANRLLDPDLSRTEKPSSARRWGARWRRTPPAG